MTSRHIQHLVQIARTACRASRNRPLLPEQGRTPESVSAKAEPQPRTSSPSVAEHSHTPASPDRRSPSRAGNQTILQPSSERLYPAYSQTGEPPVPAPPPPCPSRSKTPSPQRRTPWQTEVPICPRPPIPITPTRDDGRTPWFRSGAYTVIPPHSSGATPSLSSAVRNRNRKPPVHADPVRIAAIPPHARRLRLGAEMLITLPAPLAYPTAIGLPAHAHPLADSVALHPAAHPHHSPHNLMAQE